LEVSEAEEVKHLRDENARLKKLVADLSLDKDMLQSVIRKTPRARRAAIGCEALAGGRS
jgi:putative transposase